MRIGIVSAYPWLKKWDNYGTLLQNYALQRHLQSQGHNTYWIRATNARSQPPRGSHKKNALGDPGLLARLIPGYRRSYLTNLIAHLKKRKKAALHEKIKRFNSAHPRHFDEFFSKHIHHTRKEYTFEELVTHPPNADAYIAGSDQIWGSSSPLYFLGFGPSSTKRIAYAVSAPWSSLDPEWFEVVREEIRRFDAVSVRERAGLHVCLQLGRSDVIQVLDPTMLLDRKEYLALAEAEGARRVFERPLLLCYFLNAWDLKELPWLAVKELASKLRVDLKVIPLQGSELIIPDEYVLAPTPAEWINAFAESHYIVTNSFHGVLFAIIMRKPFLAILPQGSIARENSRIISILELLGLSDRAFPSNSCATKVADLYKTLLKPIDWSSIGILVERLRRTSITFLSNALR